MYLTGQISHGMMQQHAWVIEHVPYSKEHLGSGCTTRHKTGSDGGKSVAFKIQMGRGEAPVGEHVVLVEVVAGVGHAEAVGDVDHHLTQRHALLHDALACHHVDVAVACVPTCMYAAVA